MSRPLELHGRLLTRNTLLNVGGQALPLLVAVVAIPPTVARLGTDRFGILGIAWILLTYLGELGFGRASTKFAAEVLGAADEHRLAGIAWGTAGLQLAIGIAIGLVLAASASPLIMRVLHVPEALQPEAIQALRVLAAGVPVLLLATSFRGILEAAQRFDLLNAIRVPVSAGTYLLPLVGAWLGLGLPGIVLLLLLARAASLAGYLGVGILLYPELRRRPSWAGSDLRAMLRFGNWAAVSGLLAPVLTYLDRFMLGAMLTVSAVAYYTAPFEMTLRVLIVPASLVATLFPAFSTLQRQEPERLGRLAARSAKYVLVSIGPLVALVVVGAHDLLNLWLGPDFAREAAPALRILALGVLMNGLALVPFSLIQALGRPDLTGKLQLCELPFQVVLVYLLITRWGITGAAAAWSLRVAVDALLLFILAGRLFPLSWRGLREERLPQALLGLVALCSLAGALVAVESSLTLRLLGVALSLTAAGALLWRFALRATERAEVAAYLQLLWPRPAARS